MREVTAVAKANYRELRRVIVEHEVEPTTLLQRMAETPSAASVAPTVPVAEHPLHATLTPVGRVRARNKR
jgi:hypothetical protein